MASGRGGCSAHKLLLQPGTTTETHPALMQDLDKHVLVHGRLGNEYGVSFFAPLHQMESLCGEECAREGALGKKKKIMNRAHSGETFAKSK